MRKKLLSLLLCGVMMASMLVGCSTTKDEKKIMEKTKLL